MMNPWSVALGVIVTAALSYYAVPLLMTHVQNELRKELRESNQTIRAPLPGGDVLGYLECALFFAAFVGAGGAALIGIWLAFKTMAKWKTWDTTKEIGEAEVPVMYRLFLVGTAANLVAASVGAAVARLP